MARKKCSLCYAKLIIIYKEDGTMHEVCPNRNREDHLKGV